MRDRHRYALVAIAAGCLSLWLLSLGSAESGESFNLNILNHHPEARQWLETNDHLTALASARFASTTEALVLVKQVYKAGAERVMAHDIDDSAGQVVVYLWWD